jgi:hypothetical protein
MGVDTFIIPTRRNMMLKSAFVSKLRRLAMKLTKRGKRVRAIFILIGLWAIWQVSMNLWWTDGGYCWGTMVECMLDD